MEQAYTSWLTFSKNRSDVVFSSSNSLSKLVKLQSLQYFRLLTSGKLHRQDKGWLGYEFREPGAVPALLDAFSYMLDHLELPEGLSIPYLMHLHKIVQSGVRNNKFKAAPGEIRYLVVSRPLFAATTTMKHLEEIFENRAGDQTTVFRSKKFAPDVDFSDAKSVSDFLKINKEVLYQHWYPELSDDELGSLETESGLSRYYEVKTKVQLQFVERASLLIHSFNASMLVDLGSEDRLYHIAKLIRELSLLHLFQDGNTRLLCGVLLNQLLLRYGFLPTCLFNQNAVSDVCLDDWVAEIKQGMYATEALLNEPEASIYGFSIQELNPNQLSYMHKLALPIAAKIKFMAYHSVTSVNDMLTSIQLMSASMVLSTITKLEARDSKEEGCIKSADSLPIHEQQNLIVFYRSYEHFCGAMLFNFFNQLSQSLFLDFGLICVDERIQETQHAHLVLTYEACCAWCYRIHNHPPKAKVNFGSFYDFGSNEFLLHIALGTYHWNVGLVRFNRTKVKPYRLVRREQDAYLSVMRLVSQMGLGRNMDYRYWGLGWSSIDMGRLDDFKKSNVIELLLNPSRSSAYQNVITPFISGLCSNLIKGHKNGG